MLATKSAKLVTAGFIGFLLSVPFALAQTPWHLLDEGSGCQRITNPPNKPVLNCQAIAIAFSSQTGETYKCFANQVFPAIPIKWGVDCFNLGSPIKGDAEVARVPSLCLQTL